MNFSVVVRFFRDAVGMFCRVSVSSGYFREYCKSTYVIYGRERAVRSSHSPICIAKALKCLLRICKCLDHRWYNVVFSYW